jgi:hypothetical protein
VLTFAVQLHGQLPLLVVESLGASILPPSGSGGTETGVLDERKSDLDARVLPYIDRHSPG